MAGRLPRFGRLALGFGLNAMCVDVALKTVVQDPPDGKGL